MTGRKTIALAAGLLALALTLDAQVPVNPVNNVNRDRAEVLLQAAIKQELVEGDLKGAIEQFQKIAQSSSPEVAAQALLHMAACYDKLGQDEARNVYERVVREYPNQKNAVVEARAWLNAHGAATSQQARVSVERIWAGPDVTLDGQPFADGRYFTFRIWQGGAANLAVRDLSTGENRLLTHDGTVAEPLAGHPIPSPDGKQIAYRMHGKKDSTIRLINSDGTHMRVLARNGDNNNLSAWSPDGRYIAGTHWNGDGTGAIVLFSTADGSMTQLKSTGWQFPALGGFSPDGRFLVYSMDREPAGGIGGVFLLAKDGTVETPLVQGSAAQGSTIFRAPIWSPDGRRVIFVSDRSGARGLWSIRVTNGRPDGSPELIQASIGTMSPMGFTRDGSFYYGTQETQVEAYTAELDPETLAVTRPVPVTDRSVGNNRDPEVSPDGKHVAFLRRSDDGPGGPAALVVRSLLTGDERTLIGTLTTVWGARMLQWFPDGRSVLVTDRVDRRTRFRQVSIESGEARTLFEGPWEAWMGALSADGKALFYSIRDPGTGGTLRLVKRRLDTGEDVELYRKEAKEMALWGLTASPDGTRVAFSINTEDDKRALLIMPADGGTPREIYRGSYLELLNQGGMTWTKDGRHVVFQCVSDDGSVSTGQVVGQGVCAVPAEGGALKSLGLRMEGIPTRMISADGRRIAFTGATMKQELWVIRNLLREPAKAR